jgi:hypothetical protein
LPADSSRVARFNMQTLAERGERRFDLIQARVVPEREQALYVRLISTTHPSRTTMP